MRIEEIEAEATKRYLTEPEFHARVQLAVELASTSMRRATGMGPGREFAAGMVQSCAYGLMMADIDITPNVDEDLIANMRRTAESFGFQLIAADGPSDD